MSASHPDETSALPGLIGYWPLRGDCRDHSGHGNHGINHGVDLTTGSFAGRDRCIEIPSRSGLQFGSGEFTLSAWIHTEPRLDTAVGDVLTQYDPVRRRGLTLSIQASSGGYCAQGDDRHVLFGTDNGRDVEWEECGRPNPRSNYVSNSLTVFNGDLYAGTTDAPTEAEWAHVYRYRGDRSWEDCGRVGRSRARGVGPLISHQGHLYAAAWNYDWTRVRNDSLDPCRVYRYEGGTEWSDCGQPGRCRRLFGIASFQGSLYVVGDDYHCYVYEGGVGWRSCGQFPGNPHPMVVHHGRLYVGVLNPAGIYAFDGARWSCLGNPYGSEARCNQIHALDTYRGRLHATTWPEGRIARFEDEAGWIDCGRLGDCIEVNGLAVYNGKLYAGTIPRAEIFRYESDAEWTPLRRIFSPEGWEPATVDEAAAGPETQQRLNEWTRVTSLTVFGGKMFAGIGSCTSSIQDAPCDVRGQVVALEAGKCVSYDRDLGPGWKHLAAVREEGCLKLYVDGKIEGVSAAFDPGEYDLTNEAPLRIGSGELDSFSGKIREVRVYFQALSELEIDRLCQSSQPE
jgi:hypothetical protein